VWDSNIPYKGIRTGAESESQGLAQETSGGGKVLLGESLRTRRECASLKLTGRGGAKTKIRAEKRRRWLSEAKGGRGECINNLKPPLFVEHGGIFE